MLSNLFDIILFITFLNFISMIVVGNSWYVHYIVKDGLARKMLLWSNAMIFFMMLFLTTGGILALTGLMSIRDSMIFNASSIFFIHVIVFGQQWMQRGRSERNESDMNEADRKELNTRQKED